MKRETERSKRIVRTASHPSILESRVAFRKLQAKALCEGLGFRLGRSAMIQVIMGVFAAVSSSSSRHLDEFLR